MPRMPTAQILEPGMIAVVWIPQVRLNNKVNFQITNVVRHYWSPQIIIFQMLRQQINQILRRNRLQANSLSLTSNPPELKNTGREILMVMPVGKLGLLYQVPALPTQTCKFSLKKVKMPSSTVAPTCNQPITQHQTLTQARRKKETISNHKKGVKLHHKTLLCFNSELILYNYNIIELILKRK